MDLFEKLKRVLNCSCVSDLRYEPYYTAAKKKLRSLEIENCSLGELNDIAEYFYGRRFDTTDAVIGFLRTEEGTEKQRKGFFARERKNKGTADL